MSAPEQLTPPPASNRPPRDRALRLLLPLALLAAAALLAARLWPAPPLEPAAGEESLSAETLLEIQRDRAEALGRDLDALRPLLETPPCELGPLLGRRPEALSLPPGPKNPGRAAEGPEAAAPPSLAALMEAATVMVIAQDNNSLSSGTGFCVAPGIVATNRHVVALPGGRIQVINGALGSLQPAELLAVSRVPARDYALLRLGPEAAAKLPVLSLGEGAQRTERVSAWGFPQAVITGDPQYQALMRGDERAVPGVVYSEGSVSTVLNDRPPVIVHTAVISHGNSGGPLVNEEGRVLGINTMISLDDKSYRQMGLSLAGGDLRAFMRENNVQPR